MRNPGATYNLNDPALALYNFIDRAAGLPERGRPEDIRQRDTIIIYLGNIPEAQQEQKTHHVQRVRGKTHPVRWDQYSERWRTGHEQRHGPRTRERRVSP